MSEHYDKLDGTSEDYSRTKKNLFFANTSKLNLEKEGVTCNILLADFKMIRSDVSILSQIHAMIT